MAAVARSNPKPLVEHTLISSKTKYRYVRIKEQMLHAFGGRGGGGMFATDDSQPQSLFSGHLFQPYDPEINTSPILPPSDSGELNPDGTKKTPVQGNRKTPIPAA